MITKEDKIYEMINAAMEVRQKAYAPYSEFLVGACIEAEDGSLYTGCNIENASFSATNCAERTAIFKGVSEGRTKFKRIVIVGGKKGEQIQFCPPCGICRQVMLEFSDVDQFEIILPDSPKTYQTFLLKEILPLQFGKEKL